MTARKAAPKVDLVEALAALQAAQSPPASSAAKEEGTFTKHAVSILVVLIGAVLLWFGSTVQSLNNSVTKMSVNLEGVQKSISELQAGQSQSTTQLSTLQAAVARGDARAEAIIADQNRMKERIRILEGQKPLPVGSL